MRVATISQLANSATEKIRSCMTGHCCNLPDLLTPGSEAGRQDSATKKHGLLARASRFPVYWRPFTLI